MPTYWSTRRLDALNYEREQAVMDALAEKLDARLRECKPETAAEARERAYH
jgi:hypothetical protein